MLRKNLRHPSAPPAAPAQRAAGRARAQAWTDRHRCCRAPAGATPAGRGAAPKTASMAELAKAAATQHPSPAALLTGARALLSHPPRVVPRSVSIRESPKKTTPQPCSPEPAAQSGSLVATLGPAGSSQPFASVASDPRAGVPPPSPLLQNPLSASPTSPRSAAATSADRLACRACHQASGRGQGTCSPRRRRPTLPGTPPPSAQPATATVASTAAAAARGLVISRDGSSSCATATSKGCIALRYCLQAQVGRRLVLALALRWRLQQGRRCVLRHRWAAAGQPRGRPSCPAAQLYASSYLYSLRQTNYATEGLDITQHRNVIKCTGAWGEITGVLRRRDLRVTIVDASLRGLSLMSLVCCQAWRGGGHWIEDSCWASNTASF